MTDYRKYRRNYLKLSKYGTANTRVIQSIRNRHVYEKNLGFAIAVGWTAQVIVPVQDCMDPTNRLLTRDL